jgi:hypothetical protein
MADSPTILAFSVNHHFCFPSVATIADYVVFASLGASEKNCPERNGEAGKLVTGGFPGFRDRHNRYRDGAWKCGVRRGAGKIGCECPSPPFE